MRSVAAHSASWATPTVASDRIDIDDSSQTGVDGCRVPAAAQPGEQQRPASFLEQDGQPIADGRGETQLGKVEQAYTRIKDADDDLFTVHGRERADPHVGGVRSRSGTHSAFLWYIDAIGEQVSKHFQPCDDVGCQSQGQRGNRHEDSVDTKSNLNTRWGRFKVDIDGMPGNRVTEDEVDDPDDGVRPR